MRSRLTVRLSGSVFLPVAIVLALLVPPRSLMACPFCLSPPQSFSAQLRLCDFAIVAELISMRPGDNESRPVSHLRIRCILSGDQKLLKACHLTTGQTIQVPRAISGKPGELFLLYGAHGGSEATGLARTFVKPASSRENAGPASPPGEWSRSPFRTVVVSNKTILQIPDRCEWTEHQLISEQLFEYLRSLPPQTLSRQQQLAFFAPYLEHSDPAIAADAWAEFAASSWADVRSTKRLLKPDQIRMWIANPQTGPERVGLYGLMLGLCGNDEDATFLVRQMTNSASGDFRFGGEGLLAGYLLLTGETGLNRITPWFLSESSDDSARYALMQCLEFLEQDEPELTLAQTRRSVIRGLAANPVLQPTAVATLARWQDWESLETVWELYLSSLDSAQLKSSSAGFGVSGLRSIREFLRLCSQSESPQSATAKTLLQKMKPEQDDFAEDLFRQP